ncbi:MAG: hypothetical protein Q9164_005796 [Protoblastenia rupestris]
MSRLCSKKYSHPPSFTGRCIEVGKLSKKQMTDYLSSTNSSVSDAPEASTSHQTPSPLPPYTLPYYTSAKIRQLLEQLKPYLMSRNNASGLYKNEVLMILNLRPQDLGLLDCVVEECDERFNQEEQMEILNIIREVLGGSEMEEVDGDGVVNGHIQHGECGELQGVERGEGASEPA